jgi:hypothetical protein
MILPDFLSSLSTVYIGKCQNERISLFFKWNENVPFLIPNLLFKIRIEIMSGIFSDEVRFWGILIETPRGRAVEESESVKDFSGVLFAYPAAERRGMRSPDFKVE